MYFPVFYYKKKYVNGIKSKKVLFHIFVFTEFLQQEIRGKYDILSEAATRSVL